MERKDVKKGQLVWWHGNSGGMFEREWSIPAVIVEVTEEKYKVLGFDNFKTADLSLDHEEAHWKKGMKVITRYEVEQYFEDIKDKADKDLLEAQQRQKKAQRKYESGLERLKEYI